MASAINKAPDLTKNQSAVFDVLARAGKPLGAYDILDEVRTIGLKGPPQVYRALDKLVTLGLVHRIESLNAFLACDHGPHEEPVAFIICDDCQATVEVPVEHIEELVSADALPAGFVVDKIKLELSGHCRQCAKAAVK